MTDIATEPSETPVKRSRIPLVLGLVLALAGGGGGFYAAWSGMILGPDTGSQGTDAAKHEVVAEVAFVSVEPLVISLGETSGSRHLRFRADLEVPRGFEDEVGKLLPRVVDVFNSYLRALDPGDLEDRAALTKLRAQLLRRVQVVVGQDRVNDLLVMEFVLN